MKDFYNEAQTYKKMAAYQSPIVTLKERNEEYLKEIEKALKHKEKNIFDNVHY